MYQSTIFGTSVRPRAPPKAVHRLKGADYRVILAEGL
jgi:hypothetical protein